MIDFVFDGPPGPEGPRFIEVEDHGTRRSLSFGEWVKRDDGSWSLQLGAKEAIRILRLALERDPGYRIAWVANIAMQFQDRFPAVAEGVLKWVVHRIANEAADGFIDLLTKE
jgi:hypothetical protein